MVSGLDAEEGYVVNSIFSYHLCPRKEYCDTLKLKQGSLVLFGDNNAWKVYAICTFILKMFNDREFLCYNVIYVSEFKKNLLSISMFDDLGQCSRVEHEVLEVFHGEVIITKGF